MTDDFDDEDRRRRAAIIRRARTEGVEAAYESALQVVRDPKAPSQAKTAAQRTIMQIGGVLDYRDRERIDDKDLADMDGTELEALVQRLGRTVKSTPGGVFD